MQQPEEVRRTGDPVRQSRGNGRSITGSRRHDEDRQQRTVRDPHPAGRRPAAHIHHDDLVGRAGLAAESTQRLCQTRASGSVRKITISRVDGTPAPIGHDHDRHDHDRHVLAGDVPQAATVDSRTSGGRQR